MSKEAYYFSHDSNAFHDPKILKLRASYGLEGYGFYWALIEHLRNQPEFRIDVNDFDDLPFFLNCDEAKCKQMLSKCLDIELFCIEDDKLFSISLLRRMEKYLEISNKRKEAGRKGGLVKQTEANAKQMLKQNGSKTEALKEIKGKESKVNKENKELIASTEKNQSKPANPAFDYVNGVFNPPIPESWLKVWEESYPAVDLQTEIKKMTAWLFSNPKKRKTNIRSFINNWLAKEQDKGGSLNQKKENYKDGRFIQGFDPSHQWYLWQGKLYNTDGTISQDFEWSDKFGSVISK